VAGAGVVISAVGDNGALVAAARAGDERAFVELTSPNRRALHLHCYRLLGSLHDADDATQEALLRAWKGIERYEPHAPVRAWLYRIATNVCLRMLERRARDRAIGLDAHLEPYPDPVAPAASEPPARVESDEAVGLAFIAAMRLLPPKQRVVLVLRDVLDWSTREVAELLDDSDAAVNSALQRARARMAAEHRDGSLARAHRPASADIEALVMQRFQDAWKAVDIDGILALLTADALLTMPPEGMRFEGAGAIAEFFATVPLGGRLDRIRLIPRRANGQPALAAYAESPEAGAYEAYGVMVFAIDGERIAGITGFPRQLELFGRLGLPAEMTD
jgi:RNA polymerase sigma-70 factor (ECF subfamily)